MDGVGNVVGNPGDGMVALDALLDVETLPILGWIEEKKNNILSFVQTHEKHGRRASLGWSSALQTGLWPICLFIVQLSTESF